MNKTYEFYTLFMRGEIVLCEDRGLEIARIQNRPEGRELFKMIKQQIRNDGGKLLNLDKGEWVI